MELGVALDVEFVVVRPKGAEQLRIPDQTELELAGAAALLPHEFGTRPGERANSVAEQHWACEPWKRRRTEHSVPSRRLFRCSSSLLLGGQSRLLHVLVDSVVQFHDAFLHTGQYATITITTSEQWKCSGCALAQPEVMKCPGFVSPSSRPPKLISSRPM